ncbi:MAG: o-succinylbenzoate synthase [Bacteroidales bacterium]|nr:o-succinylbenzoate synthase [Bacteroidales bacterium]
MLQARYIQHNLIFRQAAGTSRGVLTTKESWILILYNSENPDVFGLGECSLIPRLSPDPFIGYEQELNKLCQNIQDHEKWTVQQGKSFPSIRFGLETALLDLKKGGRRTLFSNKFSAGERGIPINGLVWMGSPDFMKKQIIEKIEAGFNCIKIKVGAINFEEEISLLAFIRKQFSAGEISIRLDANGAFGPSDVFEKLKQLSAFKIHSIEQPVKQGQYELMARVCAESEIPIALDEELISISGAENKTKLLQEIKPDYIILKPSLLGGMRESDEWIKIAEKHQIGWWNTSALESNIGLNAIAQWTAEKSPEMPQGLGTGQLYTNNIVSPLTISSGNLFYDHTKTWELKQLLK